MILIKNGEIYMRIYYKIGLPRFARNDKQEE